MDLSDAFLIFYCFSQDLSISQTEKLSKTTAHSTLVRFYARMTELMAKKMSELSLNGPVEGSSRAIVEIDESLFGRKRKHNRGRKSTRQWVFGMIERGTRKTCLKVVNDRSSETLVPLIRSWVTPGSTIFSDDWRSYRDIEKYGYKHGVVVHSKELVSPSGVCTNTIEG